LLSLPADSQVPYQGLFVLLHEKWLFKNYFLNLFIFYLLLKKLFNKKHFIINEKFRLIYRKIKFDEKFYKYLLICWLFQIWFSIFWLLYFFLFYPLEFDFCINLGPYSFYCYLFFSYYFFNWIFFIYYIWSLFFLLLFIFIWNNLWNFNFFNFIIFQKKFIYQIWSSLF